jgi:phosphoglycerol transferase
VTHRADAIFAAAAALVSFAAAVLVLELWNADLTAPFTYNGDGTLNLIFVKDVLENAWFFENPRLGAPHGLELYDYPVINGETLNLLLFRIFGLGTDNPALVMNLFFLLAFPLAAVTSYLVLRRLSVARGPALAVSVLFALLPYHFTRGEAHVFLVAYYAVPLGAYLAIAVFRGDPLFAGRRGILITAAMCAVVATASGSGYYAVFTVFLVIVAAALRFVARREREALVAGGAVVAAIMAVSLLQYAPTIVYRVVNGKNDEVAKRFWFETENYSLRVTNLLLPVDAHRIDALARAKQEYTDHVPQTEARAAALGVVASVGFVCLVGVALAAAAGATRRYDFGLYLGLGVLTLASLLFATTGGFSTFLAVLWPQIRAWNRISVFIAFFSLAAVAMLLSRLERRLPVIASAVVLAAVVAVGVFDQTTEASAPPYDTVKAAWQEDASFYSALEDRLPDGAMVVNLPYEPFPEPAPGLRDPYEPAKAYLHTDDLRWSYGAMRGRPEDWAAEHTSKPAPELVAAARAEGFAGILLDREADASRSDALEAELRTAVGAEPERSPDGRFSFFRL